jgi:hypothetical protein
MIMAALVMGGVAYAGARAYHRHRQRRTPVWLFEDGRYIKTSATVVEEPDQAKIARRVNLNFNLATISVGLTAAGTVLYAPLVLVSIPLNLYDAIMMFEDTWMLVLSQGRIGLVLVSSSLVAITMVANMYLIASLLEWIYFLNQKLLLQLLNSDMWSIMAQQWQTETVAWG